MQKDFKWALIFSVGILAVLFGSQWWTGRASTPAVSVASESPTTISEDGKQVITMQAGGGYQPKVIQAKAGIPTELRVITNGTFDCSASLVIPRLNYQQFLPSTGTTIIPISATDATGILHGQCAMGMYRFRIEFQEG